MSLSYEISGEYALFADPITALSGEKTSYQIPTCGALKAITKRIYFRPTIAYSIKRVRVMNQIQYECFSKTFQRDTGTERDIFHFTYLKDVRYQVEVEMLWNYNHPERERDRDPIKHRMQWAKYLDCGGARPVDLGQSDCIANIRPCKFGEGEGYYDHINMDFDLMHYGFTYPDEAYDDLTSQGVVSHYWKPYMENGVIEFIRPQECPFRFKTRDSSAMSFELRK